MMESLQEISQYLCRDARLDLKTIALKYILGTYVLIAYVNILYIKYIVFYVIFLLVCIKKKYKRIISNYLNIFRCHSNCRWSRTLVEVTRNIETDCYSRARFFYSY